MESERSHTHDAASARLILEVAYGHQAALGLPVRVLGGRSVPKREVADQR
jgi:hypothetical protein